MVYIIKLCNNVTIQNISFFFYSVIYNQVLLASPFVILLLTGVSTNLESKTDSRTLYCPDHTPYAIPVDIFKYLVSVYNLPHLLNLVYLYLSHSLI